MTEDKLRVGTGFGQSTQLPGFQARDDLEVAAVCSGHMDKAQRVAREHHIAGAYDDYRAMLARERLDIVSITTPPHLHKDMTLAAFDAGAHVLCEKPMALDVGQAQAMCDAARAAKRIGMIDHEFRYIAARSAMQQLIGDGYIGKPYHVSIQNLGGGRADPKRPFGWWFDAGTGGGLLGAIGSHYIDAITTFVGDIVEVCGLLDTQTGQMRRVTADDNCALLARLSDGATASMHLSSVARLGGGERIQVFGSDGMLLIDQHGKLWGGKANEQEPHELPVPDAFHTEGGGLVGPFKVLLARMVDGIRQGASEVSPSFADGLKVQRVLDAVRKSSEGGGWVNVQ